MHNVSSQSKGNYLKVYSCSVLNSYMATCYYIVLDVLKASFEFLIALERAYSLLEVLYYHDIHLGIWKCFICMSSCMYK